jgi:RimK family alpha-L-glutamate ligase
MTAVAAVRRTETLSVPGIGRARRRRRAGARVAILGRVTHTNARLAAAFERYGWRATVRVPSRRLRLEPGMLALNRLDVLPTLDGVDEGLWRVAALERAGARILNRPGALLNAHDKLGTALALGRHGVDHPRTAHVDGSNASLEFGPPYVVKPRFGSWGRDVLRCESRDELAACFRELAGRAWFRRQGALVQELVPAAGRDLRIVVAGGQVAGAVARVAAPGEWRTNVALGAVRVPVEPDAAACRLALRAAAALGVDLAGVDLIARGPGRWTVLEVNGAVDFDDEYGLDPFRAAVGALLRPEPAGAALALAR